MNAKAFFELVAALRFQQKTYFKTRSADALQKSKELESGSTPKLTALTPCWPNAQNTKHPTPNTLLLWIM